MKKQHRKLTLNRETLHSLNAGKLRRIVGGNESDGLECQDHKDWEDTVTDTINSGPAACGGTLTYWGYC